MTTIIYLLLFVVVIIALTNPRLANELINKINAKKPLDIKYKLPIIKYNTFYQKLPYESKDRFTRKVNYFINSKDFVPRGFNELTDEMIALISAAAVQLTFGLPHVSLMHFDKILVYPNDYYSTINRQYHKGEVNPRFKSIVLSWHHFVAGFANPNDGINLGLHEMAHALKLENVIENEEYDFFDKEELAKWHGIAQTEMKKIKEGEKSLLRQYASVNEEEFFAVCMEVYFEQPHQLFEYNPALYKTLSNLLHQDTIKLYGKKMLKI